MDDSNLVSEAPENTKKHRLVKYVLASTAVLIGVGFIVAIVVVVILHYSAPPVSSDVVITTLPLTSAGGELFCSNVHLCEGRRGMVSTITLFA